MGTQGKLHVVVPCLWFRHSSSMANPGADAGSASTAASTGASPSASPSRSPCTSPNPSPSPCASPSPCTSPSPSPGASPSPTAGANSNTRQRTLQRALENTVVAAAAATAVIDLGLGPNIVATAFYQHPVVYWRRCNHVCVFRACGGVAGAGGPHQRVAGHAYWRQGVKGATNARHRL